MFYPHSYLVDTQISFVLHTWHDHFFLGEAALTTNRITFTITIDPKPEIQTIPILAIVPDSSGLITFDWT